MCSLKQISFFIFLGFCFVVQSVANDRLLSHYPLDIGNMWDYSGSDPLFDLAFPRWILETCIGDSLYKDGKHYRVIETVSYSLNGQQGPGSQGSHSRFLTLRRVDSLSLNVYEVRDHPNLIDSLAAKVDDTFHCDLWCYCTLVDSAMFDDVLGRDRLVRRIDCDGLVGQLFGTAEGLGRIYYSSGEGGPSAFRGLDGAVIDQDTLGTLLRNQPAGLTINPAQIHLTRAQKSQLIFFSNPADGLTVIDSVTVGDPQKFYSQPGYRGGFHGSTQFSRGPFLVFPHDSIHLELYARNDIRAAFADTMRIFARDINGNMLPVLELPLEVDRMTAVETRDDNFASTFELQPGYPNPFNATIQIAFTLPEPSHVTLVVYDLRGRRVNILVDGDFGAGDHSVVWDGRDGLE